MTVGEKIKTFRNIRGISQNMLGQLAGIGGTTIRKYELDSRNPCLLYTSCVLHYSNSLKARRCHLLLTHGITAYRIISYFLPFRCYNNRFLFLIIIYYAQKDKRKDGIK